MESLKEASQVGVGVLHSPSDGYFAASENKVHLVWEANVVWGAHGMLMSWENGKTLVLVNEFDGAITNDAREYVFDAFEQQFCTKRS